MHHKVHESGHIKVIKTLSFQLEFTDTIYKQKWSNNDLDTQWQNLKSSPTISASQRRNWAKPLNLGIHPVQIFYWHFQGLLEAPNSELIAQTQPNCWVYLGGLYKLPNPWDDSKSMWDSPHLKASLKKAFIFIEFIDSENQVPYQGGTTQSPQLFTLQLCFTWLSLPHSSLTYVFPLSFRLCLDCKLRYYFSRIISLESICAIENQNW